MKPTLSLLLVLVILGTSGCYYPQPKHYSQSPLNATTVGAGLLGAAGGGYIGNQINKDYGAPVGAAAGALAAGGITAILQQRHQREVQEAYEDGQRRGMSIVFDEWWSEHAILIDPAAESKEKGARTRQIAQPAGTYESVPYHKRSYPYIVQPNPAGK